MNGAKGASPFLIGWILLKNQLNFSENKETQGTKIKLSGSLLDTAWKVKLTFFFKVTRWDRSQKKESDSYDH